MATEKIQTTELRLQSSALEASRTRASAAG